MSSEASKPAEQESAFDGVPLDQIVFALIESAQAGQLALNPFAQRLGLSPEDVERAVRMDKALAEASPDADPIPVNVFALVEARIKALEEAYNSPEAKDLRDRQAQLAREADAQRLADEASAKEIRGKLRRLGLAAVTYTGLIGVPGYFAAPYIFDGANQLRMDYIASHSMDNRAEHLMPVGDMDLEGATVRFACRSVAKQDEVTLSTDQRWEPVQVDEVWNHNQLKEAFGVQWAPDKTRTQSLAEAGWGNTVTFTKDQLEQGLPQALLATAVEVPEYGSAALLPTGTFVPDPDHIVNAVFTTGMVSPDGHMNTYYLMDPSTGDLACYKEKPITEESEPVRMVTARLVKELPEKNLATFGAEDLEVSPTYAADFDKYGLGAWYKRTYPALVKSVDYAIRDASKRGVPNATLQEMADYLKNREFEQGMLRLMIFMQTQYGDKALRSVVESIDASETPSLILTDDVQVRKEVADGLTHPEARGAVIQLVKDAHVRETLTHELMHAFVQASPAKIGIWRTLSTGNFTEQDSLLTEAQTEFFTQVALGHMHDFADPIPAGAAYPGRFELLQYLMSAEGGDKNNVLDHYLLKPHLELTPTHLGVLTKIGAPIPDKKVTRDMYAMLLDHLKLTDQSSPEDLEKATKVFKALREFAGMELGSVADRDIQEMKAREILALIK